MGVAASLDLGEIPLQRAHQLLHPGRLHVGDLVRVAPDYGNLPIVQVDHVPRMSQDRGGVRRHPVLVLPQPEKEGRTMAGSDQCAGIASADHGDPVRSLNLPESSGNGFDERAIKELLDEVRQHLCIGVGPEAMTLLHQPFSQAAGVLDDAVVHDGQCSATVDVRVGVDIVGHTVGRPAGMCQSDSALRHPIAKVTLQLREAPRRLLDDQATVLDHCDTSRIVPPVLETLHALQQQRRRATSSDVANNSAHETAYSRSRMALPAAISRSAAAASGASAINRTIGSVPEGRICSH